MSLKQLEDKIKKALPEIETEYNEQETVLDNNCNVVIQQVVETGRKNVYIRPITLEDVLRVLEKEFVVSISYIDDQDIGDGWFILCDGFFIEWYLGKPLSEQSPDTIKELNNLIT